MDILKIIFGIFALIGALDRIFGNKLKLGEEFEKGILVTGSLALVMVGMMNIVPVLSKILIPIFSPISEFLHIDPSFIGTFIASDMGGAMLSTELSPNSVWGVYNGFVVASMLGITICFSIPVPLRMVEKKYHKDVLNGILCGVATMPIGCIAGGILLGCPFLQLLLNTLPVIIVSIITCLGLVCNADLCRKIFGVIGNILLIVMTIGLGCGVFESLTAIQIIPGALPIEEGFAVVVEIAILLTGIYPFIAVVSKIFRKPLTAMGKFMKIDGFSVLGLISTLANAIPTMGIIDKMNTKGIVMNMAFVVSASFVFGDHLAFTMGLNEAAVVPMIVGKLVSGVCALIVAHFIYKYTYKEDLNK